MKRSLSTALLLLLLAVSMTACGGGSTQTLVSEALDLDVSGGSEVSCLDTHSGNGDGVSCIVLHFDGDAVSAELAGDTAWNAFPLDETAQALVYGMEGETGEIGPFLTDDDGTPLVPDIQHGYYLLIDRQTGTEDAADLLERNSFNVTLGLYDTDTDTLYCCQLDT